MKAKDYLKSLRRLDKLIENKLAEKEQWRAIATNVTQHLSGERVQTSGNQQKMADAVIKLVDIEKEIDKAVDNYVDSKREVIATITKLNASNETYYDVLHKIYVQYFTLNEVAEMYGKERSWIDTIHGRALKIVQRIIDERDRYESSDKS